MQDPNSLPIPRKVAAGRGWRWFVEAFQIVRLQPLTWVLLTLVYILIQIGLSIIPLLGDLASALIGPVFAASFVLAAAKSERGEELELADLFAAFRQMPGPLLLLGAMLIGLMLAIIVAGVALGASGGLMTALLGKGSISDTGIGAGAVALLVIVAGVGGALLGMAYWFAPALVALSRLNPWPALRTGLKAGLRNWLPLLVVSLVLMVSCVLALLPLGLGLLLWIPVASVTAYTGWRDVFGPQQ
ncbi:hypothetical protein DK842_08385 [Chromobacterium phragmitis]|uniref:BPSS1780 family membrane protein n=1 Tax=Chromobacterium phragmitis TaxID=2202141 RepID=A0ABV0IXE0_9NEIS|nr:BPSS1780 family membrane protein [Chromobacterium phragmitis]AXE29904.1 hypothetical protein DK842_08385 [Chromobacterium phragmitis]